MATMSKRALQRRIRELEQQVQTLQLAMKLIENLQKAAPLPPLVAPVQPMPTILPNPWIGPTTYGWVSTTAGASGGQQ